MFQSTYLYKVRQYQVPKSHCYSGFNPRTYIRYDSLTDVGRASNDGFNPRTYIRYDTNNRVWFILGHSFNPRTYIRYDED